jgi:hypothetical protein
MKRRLIAGSLLLVCGALAIGAHYWVGRKIKRPAPEASGVLKPGQTIGAPAAVRKGTIDFSETTFDLGDVKRGEMATHVFRIKNNSDQPLKITRVRGS